MRPNRQQWYVQAALAALAAAVPAVWALGWIELFQPAWLLGLLALPVFPWLAGRSRAGLPPAVRHGATMLRALLAVLLLLALADARLVRRNDDLAVLFLLDRSASIPAPLHEAQLRYLRAAAANKAPDDRVGIAVFGGNVSIETAPETHPRFTRTHSLIDAEFTNIEEALRVGTAVFPPGLRRKIVLVTDGNDNAGDMLAGIRHAAAEGVAVDVLPVTYDFDQEVMLTSLDTPPTVAEREVFDIRLAVTALKATTATVQIYRNGQPLLPEGQSVALDPGENVFTIPNQLDAPGFYTYRARVTAPDDAILANNDAVSFVHIAGRSRLLFVAPSTAEVEHLAAVARARQIEVDHALPGAIPADAASLQAYDAVILANVPADTMTRDQMTALHIGVREFGMGLAMIGGPHSFGAGGYQGTPIEAALPVHMEVRHRKVLPQGALILAIDCSGSMQGDKIDQAKPAAWAAAQALNPRDYIGVLAFTDGNHWQIEPTLAQHQPAIRAAIARLGAGGGTDIMGALKEARLALRGLDAAIKHIVILSDGQADHRGFGQLMGELRADAITVTSIGIGERDGQPLMREIAQQTGGRFHYVRDPRQLPQVFIKEALVVRRGAIFEEPFVPVLADASELARDLQPETLPPLGGYVLATARPRAVVPLVSANDNRDPIFAHWRYGRGKAVAFTSDATGNWGRRWVSWPGYGPFWSRTLRWLARERNAVDFTMRTELDGERGRLVIDALDKHGQYVNFMAFQPRLVDPDHEVTALTMRQTAPGRYEAEFQARKFGVNMLNVIYTDPRTGAHGSATTGVSVQPSPEHRRFATDHARLREAARLGGGRILPADPTAAAIYASDLPPQRRLRVVWEWLLVAAILIFLADVALRRIVITRADLAAVATAMANRLPWRQHRDETRNAMMSSLLERKRQARAAVGANAAPTPREPTPKPRPAVAERSAPAALRPTPPPPTAAKPTAAPDADHEATPDGDDGGPEDSFTARLLAAKRRAQRRQ